MTRAKSSPLIVTGMHRSGTSLVARYFHESGIDLGDELVGPARGNDFGHFEDVQILQFHRSILHREFLTGMWVPALPRLTEEDRAQAGQLIEVRRHKARWGWKEPRTCLFLEMWDQLVPDATYLFLVRHPKAVVDSLARRHRQARDDPQQHHRFLKSWDLYTRQCARLFDQHPDRCILVILEHLIADPKSFVDVISQRLAYAFSADLFHSVFDSKAMQSQAQSAKVQVSWMMARRAEKLYRQLQKKADV